MAGLSTRLTSASTSLNAAFRGLSLNNTTPLTKRGFSTSLCLQKRKVLPEQIPQYPFKPNYQYKAADSGLYGGVSISYGNKISKGRNKGKTRRSWKPNVRWKNMPSEALGKDVFIKLTRKALRTIRKSGGLDQYLLSDKSSRIKELGLTGWQLRYRIMESPEMRAKFAKTRKELGLRAPPKTFEEWLKAKELEEEELKAVVEAARQEAAEKAKGATKVEESEQSSDEKQPLPPTKTKSKSGKEKEKSTQQPKQTA